MIIRNKLIIGTANFGLRYGIANDRKLSREEAFAILDYAHAHGIQWIDTAGAYGDAERVVGEYFAKRGKVFKVIGKLPAKEYMSAKATEDEIYNSLKNMNITTVDVLLLHSFDTYKRDASVIIPVLQALCRDQVIGSYGVSVYHPEEVVEVTNNTSDKLVFEFPLNLFDQRFLKYNFMRDIKNAGCRFFARSVFLQGLFFLGDRALNGRFVPAREKIAKIRMLSETHYIRPECLALLFAAQKPWVDGVVIGVDSLDHLRRNSECLGPENFNKYASLEDSLPELAIDDEDIILPYRWNA